MKNLFVLLFTSLFISSAFAHPQDNLSAEELIHYYVKVFNDENLAALQDVYYFPHTKQISGQLTIVKDKNTPVIDYEGLKKSGWRYSKINSVKVLAEGANAALVELNFSRFNAEDKEFLNQTGFYYLTKNSGYWQVMSIILTGAVAGVKAK